ncbi:MAG TPA: DUF2917 domain-containing protein [Burkholderiales bacterium]|nr:DUF2917 domain-containing protein [Burkholderiales bacterium]
MTPDHIHRIAVRDATGSRERYVGTIGSWIAEGEVVRIQDGRGLLLSVQYGKVWITQAGSVKDVFVDSGGSFRIDRDGRTLVSVGGSEPAAFTLARSTRPAPSLGQRVAAGWNQGARVIATLAEFARCMIAADVADVRNEAFRGGLHRAG